MRKLIVLLLLAIPAFAQERRVFRPMAEWSSALPAFEKRVQLLTAGIKRDAFIVAQVTLAAGDLSDDFQKLSAMEKAHDRIGAAVLRANQEPVASLRTLTALSKMSDALEAGRRQGTMANLEDLRAILMRETQPIQRELFTALREARGERLNLVELLNRVQTLNADLEGAMVEALGSTFDFMAAGGK